MEQPTHPTAAPTAGPGPATGAAPGPDAGSDPGIAGLESVFSDLEARLDALIEARLENLEARRAASQRAELAQRFAAEHPDFETLRENGALAARQRENPLLGEVGAYFAHHLAEAGKASQEEAARVRQDALAEGEARAMERLRARRGSVALDAPAAAPRRGRADDPQLEAPDRFGGVHAVLAARMAARRRDAGL
ncbi:MAG: hypothetical protein B193_1592 [Solidesulfovibrio magneticus str. Maddingley MBC34]|uniref:Uncharacterized protein n=1 Tax=Solidesulfovibrio magneticus str. Maddingley MBC34 TaxID=1206767 RepID=K6FMC5_9BACT|nr:MAG: hypothetical protein B193_1592 [Solidesulfovibrio magneticus str. Maddingley MBC34]